MVKEWSATVDEAPVSDAGQLSVLTDKNPLSWVTNMSQSDIISETTDTKMQMSFKDWTPLRNPRGALITVITVVNSLILNSRQESKSN